MIARKQQGPGFGEESGGEGRHPPDRRSPESETDAIGRLREALAATGHRALQDIDLDLREGVLVLQGTVPSFYLKQLAQHAALETPGIEEIDNQLEVQPQETE